MNYFITAVTAAENRRQTRDYGETTHRQHNIIKKKDKIECD